MKTSILLPNIFDHPFTYKYTSIAPLKLGDFVKVQFGTKEYTGIVWDTEHPINKKIKIKKITKKIDIQSMNPKLIKFITWFSKYNIIPLGLAFKMTLLSKNVVEKKINNNFIKYKNKKKIKRFKLNLEQKNCLSDLKKYGNKYNVTVLQGVTGSGKTLVYFERIKEIINKNSQALIMLPEIALTEQFSKRFRDFFGTEPAIWHSKTSIKNKKIIWRGVLDNNIKIVIGARSSLFLPFNKLGVIIVDEEHDSSYKQDEGVSYNARDMAITRASLEDIPITLVTAIPSVETYNNILTKKYNSTFLTERYKKASLPNFEIINLKTNVPKKGTWIATKTIEIVKKSLEQGNQILFFLNRRGYAPFVICKNCNKKFQCPDCSVNLVFHKIFNKLLCHYCGYKCPLSRTCNSNNECEILMCGPGVERIYSELKLIFPNKKIEIFSSDLLIKNKSNRKLIDRIEKHKVDIIVGTQLISKGFHFPKLNCIVVVDADLSSHGYDLRSAEKNIQLFHQLAGRAGREGKKSAIYFQTYTPGDEILLNISKNDPNDFLKRELILRKDKRLPPFYKLISLIISGQNEQKINQFAIGLKSKIPKYDEVDILGPVNAPIFKLKKDYRCRILIRYPKNLFFQKYLTPILKNLRFFPGIKLGVDVDPINFS